MIKIPSPLGVLPLVLWFGISHAFAQEAGAQAAAQPAVSATGTPTDDDEQKAERMVQTNSSERHIAPHDTFYMLSYVAVKTGVGVEGFTPGQEVHLVEINRADHTLIVSDGHAQVEVPPSQLTNDIDMARAARQQDQASQTQVAAYAQKEQEAYDKFQKDAAEATRKDLDQHNKEVNEQVAARVQEENTQVAATAPSANVPLSDSGYYNDGGYGYGNAYSYFVNTNAAAPASGTKASAAPAVAPNNVAAPAAGGHAAGGGRAK